MRTLLLILVAFIGLTATTCGLLMIAYPLGSAMGLSIDMLRPTIVKDFLIPGILLTIVGIINMGAVFAAIQRSRNRYNWSLAAGMLVCIWVVAEVILLQAVHWLQVVYLFTGILIVLLSYQFKGKWAA